MDTKSIVIKSLESSYRLLRMDLHALPEDVFNRSLGGKSRTVSDLIHEVDMVNDREVREIQGEPTLDWPEGWITAPSDLQTKNAVIDAFEASAKNVMDAANSFSSEELEAPFQSENGETTRAAKFRFITLHNWYHSGQLNFIQTLLGDDDFHWAK